MLLWFRQRRQGRRRLHNWIARRCLLKSLPHVSSNSTVATTCVMTLWSCSPGRDVGRAWGVNVFVLDQLSHGRSRLCLFNGLKYGDLRSFCGQLARASKDSLLLPLDL